MKHIIVGNENGQPVYYDHPNGQYLSMTFGTKMTFAYNTTGDRWRLIRCKNTLFVFASKGCLHFLILSNEGDSENYLRHQIQFLQDLFVVKYGPDVFTRDSSGSKQKALVSLFNNTKRLFHKEQSFLLGVSERLEMGDDKLSFIAAIVKKVLNEYGIPQIYNVLLTIKTKVILNYAKPKQAKPIPVDEVLLLIAFIHSHFNVMSADFTPREFQAADYTDHSNIKSRTQYKKESSSGKESEEEFVSCDSGTEIINDDSNTMESYDDLENGNIIPTSSQPIIQLSQSSDTMIAQSVPISTGIWKKQDSQPSISNKEILSGDISPSITRRLSDQPIINNKKKNIKKVSTPLHCDVYLRYTDTIYSMHSYELEGPINLTLLTVGDDLTEEEKDKLWILKREIKNELQSLMVYMNVLYRTHLESVKLTYIHQLPGLVHFMYVERNSERLLAPKISGLVGQKYDCNGLPSYRTTCKDYLRTKIWDLVYHSQDSLLNGYNTMLLTKGDYQYSYRLWFEDPETSVILPIDKSLKQIMNEPPMDRFTRSGRVLSSTWYIELTKRLFPNNKRVKCYELYSLYLSGLNAKTISNHNNTLVSGLRSR